MKKTRSKKTATRIYYTLAGVLFGLLFPLFATLNEINTHHLDFSWNSARQIHENHLFLIIDSAPFFFGLAASLAGIRQQKFDAQNRHLEELVNERSEDILRQKLFYEAMMESNPIAIVTLDRDKKIISINPAFQKLFGYSQKEVVGKDVDKLIANPDAPEESFDITQKVFQGSTIHEFGKRKCKDGQLVDVEIFGEQIKVNGDRLGVLGLYRDITAEKQAQEALRASEERFRRMFSDSPVALRLEDYSRIKKWLDKNITASGKIFHEVLEADKELFEKLSSYAKIIDLNDATLYLFGAKNVKELQNNLRSLLRKESRNNAAGIIEALLHGETTVERELVYRRLDGKKIYTITRLSILPGHENSWSRILFSNMDITERKLTEERLTYISLHDVLTGLYNRAFFEEEMERMSKSRIHPTSILVMDMDNLKDINDKYGHQAGDAALQAIANIIRDCFRSDDVIARIGGDEIAVLQQGVGIERASEAKECIVKKLVLYNASEGIKFPLSLSIGYAAAFEGEKLSDAFKIADKAMYQEKKERKNSPLP